MKRKRMLSLLLALAMVLTMLPIAGASAKVEKFVKNGSSAAVTVYASETTTDPEDNTLGSLEAGKSLSFLSETTSGDNTWYKVQFNAENVGYILKQDGVTIEEVKTPELKVTGGGTNNFEAGKTYTVTAEVVDGEGYTIEYSTDNGTNWSTTAPSLTEPGKLTVKVQATKSGEKTLTSDDVTLEVTGVPTLTAKGGTFEYDGKAHAVTASIEYNDGYSIRYSTDNGTSWSTTVPSLTEPGKLTVKVKAIKSGAADLTCDDVTLEVVKTAPEPKLTATGGTFTQDGKPHAVTAKVENGEGYTIEYSSDGGKTWSATAPSLTEPGKLTVKVRATKSGETTLTCDDVTLEVTAAAAKPEMTVTGGKMPYDGKAYTVAVAFKNAKAEEFDITYSTDGGKTWVTSAPGQKEVGKLTIKVKATLKADKTVVLEGEGTVEIVASTTTRTVATIVNCTTSVNVRKGAGSSTAKIGEAKKGAQYTVLAVEGDWYKIQYSSSTVGYVHKSYVSAKTVTENVPVETPAADNQIATVVNCKSSVNVRSGAGTSNGLVGSAKKDAQYKLLATVKVGTATWYKVQYTPTKVGYIHGDYIKVTTGSTGTPSSGQTVTIVNCNNRVNVRQGASSSTTKLGTAPKGATYTYLGKSSDGNWYQIQYKTNQKGYVYKDYVKLGSGGSNDTTPSGQIATIVNCNEFVNVRKGAGSNTTKLGTAKKGATYTYLGKSGNWIQVQYSSTEKGYIYSKYVQVSGGTTGGTTGGDTATETTATGYGYVVNCSASVNVRSGAGTGNSVIGTAAKSNVYQILGKSGNWYKIQYKSDTVGYIHDSYFTRATSDTSKKATVVNCTTSVNVRSAATTSAAKLGEAKLGETFVYLKTMDNYVMVIYNGRVGCIHKNYAKIG